MSTFTLEPYNYYILYAAIIVFIIFAAVTVIKVMPLMKTIAAVKPQTDKIQTELKEVQSTWKTLHPEKKGKGPSAAELLSLIVFLKGVEGEYRKSDQKGPRRFADIAAHKAYDQASKKQLKDSVMKLFS